ncbi:glycoside hydrolase [Auriculariales sp. MPI-PUGE-AT-0066]|nr:glycoside hydrolase [Auriculariales sp. MPI-PUGE-AT-0066]
MRRLRRTTMARPRTTTAARNGSNSGNGSSSTTPSQPSVLLGGFDGSEVTLDDGSKLTYTNSFGGSWYYDPDHPLDGPAGQANSWTPPVNESWRWGTDKQFGVNLGGWLVLEPFITPAMYDRFYPNAIDEWTLSTLLAAETARGGLNQIEDHYKTFITEADFANIAAAGLNWIRLPVPFWAISKLDSEPFLEKVSWQYFLKAIVWARKYGLRINLDLHTLPGSQNGWNHSGRLGQPFNWMQGVMGIANAQRSMDYIRIYAEFISKPEITNVVPMFGVLNEPRGNILGEQPLKDVYYNIYTTLRGMTGIGKGPVLSFHTGFFDNGFAGWLPKADRLMLDRHPYLVFGDTQSNAAPETFARTPCVQWKQWTDTVSNTFGMNSAGEWSCALSDCALYINEVGIGADYDAQFGEGACKPLLDYKNWSSDFKAGVLTYTSAMMDAFGSNFFFWTWRIGPSTRFNNTIQAPDWSYELGLQEGWIPKDPRTASGTCTKLGYDSHSSFDGAYDTWQLTGEGATLNPATTEAYPWPPASLTGLPDGGALPTYTATGAIPTLVVTDAPAAMQTFTPDLGGVGMMVPIANCQYPDAYNAGMTVPEAC